MEELEKRVEHLGKCLKMLEETVTTMALVMTELAIMIARNSKFVGVSGMDEIIDSYKTLLEKSEKIISSK